MKNRANIALRVVFVLLAAIGIVVMIYGWNMLSSYRRYYDNVRSHEAIRLAVDLATLGEYRGIFKQKFITEHGKQLRLIVEPPFSTSEEMAGALSGLCAHIEIRKPNGIVCRTEDVEADSFYDSDWIVGCEGYAEIPDHTLFLFYDLAEAEFDNCDFVFTVIEPAEGLRGRRQTFISTNVYCRTASDLPPIYAKIIMVVGGLLLGVPLLIVVAFVVITTKTFACNKIAD